MREIIWSQSEDHNNKPILLARLPHIDGNELNAINKEFGNDPFIMSRDGYWKSTASIINDPEYRHDEHYVDFTFNTTDAARAFLPRLAEAKVIPESGTARAQYRAALDEFTERLEAYAGKAV